MFKKIDGNIIFENNGKVYDFLNNVEDYKEIIILLTNPQDDVQINLDLDSNLSDEEFQLCNNYKEFIEDFLNKRKEYLESDKHDTDEKTDTYITMDDELPF